jgi:2-oxoglutarate ferredoxin oxidoreductase subunit alpha
MTDQDITLRIGGEAGMGLESSGAGFAKALTRGGLYTFGLPDYQSRIRGGHNFFSIRVSPKPLFSHAEPVHLLLALDQTTIGQHVGSIVEGGAVIYDPDDGLPNGLDVGGVGMFPVPLTKLASERGGRAVMRNTLALAVATRLMDFDPAYVESIIRDNFARKGQAVIDANLRVLEAGLEAAEPFAPDFSFQMRAAPGAPDRLVLNGNEAFSMGALAGGCRFVAAYPMTPGSPVLHWFAAHADEYGAVTKHAEDELAAINMAIGAAYAGARALVPTSGGGFSLMVEALGLAGITETPVVVYEAQRPGPATGMPTRTEQADLLFAIHASQGEFPRAVLAPGTIEQSFRAGWQSFNLAERFQTPVIVLSDHYLANSYRTIEAGALDFGAVTIDRGDLLSRADLDRLAEPYRRFRVSQSGVSARAMPGHRAAVWVTTANEHDETGAIDESAANRTEQVEKRQRKLAGMRAAIEPPTRLGPEKARSTLVGWGSSYGPLREAAQRLNASSPAAANVVHFHTVWPLVEEQIEEALSGADRVIVVEGNATGQLETLLRRSGTVPAVASIRRYDGRAFTPEYIVERVREVA